MSTEITVVIAERIEAVEATDHSATFTANRRWAMSATIPESSNR
jgi:hypothetical protein